MAELRQQLIDTARRMAAPAEPRHRRQPQRARGEQEGDLGFLITPTGMAYDVAGGEDIVRMRLDGTAEGRRKPSSEWRFHRDLYAARPTPAPSCTRTRRSPPVSPACAATSRRSTT
jgi:L-fuculose-phosphate aldolase